MNPRVAITIAGSDNSSGAGIQADLKTFSALGVYALTTVTCVVAEVPGKVSAIQPMSAEVLQKQLSLSFDTFPIAAVKTGMLFSKELIELVCAFLEKKITGAQPRLPLVVDPVMVATSGDSLLHAEAIEIYRKRLFKIAALVTPNLDEAAVLAGEKIQSREDMQRIGRLLANEYKTAFLLKGGHLRDETATDFLFLENETLEFSAPYIRNVSTHGTGCTYSAAITAGLAQGLTLRDAVSNAKTFVTRSIQNHFHWTHNNHSTNALNHFK